MANKITASGLFCCKCFFRERDKRRVGLSRLRGEAQERRVPNILFLIGVPLLAWISFFVLLACQHR